MHIWTPYGRFERQFVRDNLIFGNRLERNAGYFLIINTFSGKTPEISFILELSIQDRFRDDFVNESCFLCRLNSDQLYNVCVSVSDESVLSFFHLYT